MSHAFWLSLGSANGKSWQGTGGSWKREVIMSNLKGFSKSDELKGWERLRGRKSGSETASRKLNTRTWGQVEEFH